MNACVRPTQTTPIVKSSPSTELLLVQVLMRAVQGVLSTLADGTDATPKGEQAQLELEFAFAPIWNRIPYLMLTVLEDGLKWWQGDANGIQGLIQSPEGSFQMEGRVQGAGLLVASGGEQYMLVRQGGANAQTGSTGQANGSGGARPQTTAPQGGTGGANMTSTGRPLAPGFTEDHPEVQEWTTFLAGNKLTRMSSYSSGSAGGYSARADVYLCSDRSFAMRDESSVAVDVGGAFGNSSGTSGGQGRWYVIANTNTQVVVLVLEYADGQSQEFRMEYQNQATYANGERAYVTPAEICG